MPELPVFAIARHRIGIDGPGVTTLVGVQGCPLACRWCLNPHARDVNGRHRLYTAGELYDAVRIDNLYFAATGGGVVFGGGEPLLHADFLPGFRALCGSGWKLSAETSLNVPAENVMCAAKAVDLFIVDIKDMNPDVYRRYTGRDNAQTVENLERLLEAVGPQRVLVRVPLIPQYNEPADREKSIAALRSLGVARIDSFSYVLRDGQAPH